MRCLDCDRVLQIGVFVDSERLNNIEKLLDEVRSDVKILLENMHREQGAKSVKTAIIAAVVSVIALFCNVTVNYLRIK